MIATLFALVLSATSPQASAFSHGFSARSLAQASPGIDVASTRAALTRMEALRALLILGPARTTIRLDPMEARALAAALGRFDGPGGKSIAWFMRGAITRVGVFDGRYVAGFYNPLVDAWLIAPLAVVGGEFRITGATLIDGQSFRTAPARLWSDAPRDNFAALVDGYRGAIEGFDDRYDHASSAVLADAFTTVGARTNAWMENLGRWRAGAAGISAVQRVCDAIAAGRIGRAGIADAGVAAQIDGLPIATRGALAVTGAVKRGDHVSLLLIAPNQPELILVLDLDAQQRPVGLAVVNLGNAT